MPNHENVTLSGVVKHVFAHRFTLESGGTTHLADLSPKGLEAFPLREGLPVSLEGERRPSEIKVTRIAAEGGTPVAIEHKKPHHAPGRPADPAAALKALREAGWTVSGEPRAKPKHFEVLARKGSDPWAELHVEFDGAVRKQKPADAEKWAEPA